MTSRETGAPGSRRPRRRAVGPAGAVPSPGPEPRVEPEERAVPVDDDERFLRDRPPHHDQAR